MKRTIVFTRTIALVLCMLALPPLGCGDSEAVCGDGRIQPDEVCDDGNRLSGDGCAADCRSDETCGNGLLDVGEVCDDGNTEDDVLCRSDCQQDYTLCGNGTREPGEACDQGGMNSDTHPDACRSSCQLPTCGDGTTDTGEECDAGDPNGVSPEACLENCELTVCGDGYLGGVEECDDGTANSDTDPNVCHTSCRLTWCGDGIVNGDELCDEGSTEECATDCLGDCSATCARRWFKVGDTAPSSVLAELRYDLARASFVYDGALWLVGFTDTGAPLRTAVWRSDDGLSWTRVGDTQPLSVLAELSFHSPLVPFVFAGQMWLLGVSDSGGQTQWAAYSSVDGQHWTRAGDISPATVLNEIRTDVAVVSFVFANEMWLLGFTDAAGVYQATIWRSADGVSWLRVGDTVPSSVLAEIRPDAALIPFSYGGHMWLLGFTDSGGQFRTAVWRSADGLMWDKVGDTLSWSILSELRYDFDIVPFVFEDGTLTMVGYVDDGPGGIKTSLFRTVWGG